MASTNGTAVVVAAMVASPTTTTTAATAGAAVQGAESTAAATHSKNTAGLCRYTMGDIPPPLIGASVTCAPLSALLSTTF